MAPKQASAPIETAATKSARPVYVYQIPKEIGTDVASVGLVQLTAREEMMAAKRAGGDSVRMAYEQVMQALVEVNGETVGIANGSAETAFNSMSPMVRNLVMTAHVKLHAPEEATVADFLKSREVRVA